MAPVYADHPFSVVETPLHRARKEDPNFNPKDDEIVTIASDMAVVHSGLVRGLNSIYLQAPHIQPADEKYFLFYMKTWCIAVETHHHEEETLLFPWVEELTGVKGLMEGNLEQHKAFHGGLEQFQSFIDEMIAGTKKYDGVRIVELIDSFGQVLAQHLSDEIPTLMGLKEYAHIFTGENSIVKKFDQMAKESMKGVTIAQLMAVLANIDREFEDGLWSHWPPIPAPVFFIIRWIFWPLNGNVTRFGAVDKYLKMKPLLYTGAKE